MSSYYTDTLYPLQDKILSVISRDEPKDVVDIWILAKNNKIDWPQVFQSVSSKAAGIFPPEVAQKLLSLPLELLDQIKWVEGQKPNSSHFLKELNQICDAMLVVKL